jgi:magnesium chelatase family protein
MVSRYQKRISGSLLDRIDIHIEVPRVEYEKPSDERLGEPSETIRARVEAARQRQRKRCEGTGLMSNADMGPAEVRGHCPVDDAGKSLLRAARQQLRMRARAYHRILKLAMLLHGTGLCPTLIKAGRSKGQSPLFDLPSSLLSLGAQVGAQRVP